jgi:uncharacterized membrane protein YtjA (UPF0391 family)
MRPRVLAANGLGGSRRRKWNLSGGQTFSFQVHSTEDVMLSWALIFFVVAIIAAVFGFGGIASASAGIAQILFFVFLVLFVVSLIMGMARRG